MTNPEDRTPGQPEPVSYWPPRPTAPVSPAAGYLPVPAQPQSPGPYPPAAYGPLVRPTSGMATASMIFGIVGLFLFCLVVPSLVAVLCGHSAVRETRQGNKAGHGQAVAGLILGYAVLGPAVFYGVFMLIGLFTS